jgi:hypothetical protein
MGSILGSVLRGFAASDAAKKAKKAQKQNIARAERAYREVRGSTGSAILPLYFGENSESFEKELAGDLMDQYRGAQFPTTDDYQGEVDKLRPGVEGATDLTNRLLTGDLTEERVSNYKPVFEARKTGAAASREAGIKALSETLNQIEAMQAKRGFGGESFGKNLLRARAGRDIAEKSAGRTSAVEEQNALDEARLRTASLDQMLASTGLPFAMAQRLAALQAMPNQMMTQDALTRMAPFDWFRIGNFMPNIPQKKPIPGDTQIWLNTGADIADTIADIALSYATSGAAVVDKGQFNNGMDTGGYVGGGQTTGQMPSYGGGGSDMGFDFNQDYTSGFGGYV